MFCLNSANLVNGLATTKFPSVVALLRPEGNFYTICTGTFVSHNTLVTAAHCIDESESGGMFYVPGHYIKDIDKSWGEKVTPIKAFHATQAKTYTNGSQSILLSDSIYDLAILLFPENTAPSTSPLLNRTVVEDETVTVVGFGKSSTTNPSISSPLVRRYGQNKAVQNPEDIFPDYVLPDGLVGTIGRSETDLSAVNSCQLSTDSQAATGDSGGPLFFEDRIAATTSVGQTNAAQRKDLAVYVDLNSAASKALMEKATAEGATFEAAE